MDTDMLREEGEIIARLRRLEDERDIQDLLCRYGHSIDYGLESDFVDCFAADGAFIVQVAGAEKMRIEGRDALANFVSHHTRPPDKLHKHIVADSRIKFHGDRAEVRSYFIRINAENGRPDLVAFGRYVDQVARGSDHRWRFLTRVSQVDAFDDSKQPGTWTRL